MGKASLSARICALLCCLIFLLPRSPAVGDAPTGEALGVLRYAVCLYGIRHDACLGLGEERAGLSFGPAIGENYTQSFHAHVTQEAYREDRETNLCLHWMSWEEIAEQSLRDPEVFRPCLEAGCTHAVELTARRPLFSGERFELTGDGASCLFYSLTPDYLCWNNDNDITGGYPASRIRATLNGRDAHTDPSLAGKQALSEEDCLFSCFPAELRERIVPKAVVSDLSFDKESSECVTSYDRLFLFSARELYGELRRAKPSEGLAYEKSILRPATPASLDPAYRFFSEKGEVKWTWLRSASHLTDVMVYSITGAGHALDTMFFDQFALAPGFCLP